MALLLVADDEFGILRLLEDVLGDEGHTVVIAINGRLALDQAEAKRPDLLLTDFMMPVMDGAGLIRGMNANPALATVPVIVMSSLPEAAIADRCPPYAAFVRKPFKIFSLIDLIASQVDGAAR
ncbi:response regulator [Glacieibacterium sp.]|uniref:response regulator n=1 Tax=Glacieibacterium sp. TaxID=2860237 RepID=UPI003AFF91AD